ncbi:MAG: trypsin-like peptidase domain-containing protein [Acholeplasmataceae bacterium]
MKIKRIFLSIIVLSVSLILVSCNLAIIADTDYESPSTYENTRIDMIADVKDSVVVVENSDSWGSGIIFNMTESNAETGLMTYAVLTVYSVIEEQNLIDLSILMPDGTTYPATEVKSDQDYEIAVVYIETTDELEVYTIEQLSLTADVSLVQGEDLYAIGTPYQYTLFNYVSQGILGLISFDLNVDDGLLFVHSAETNPGMEGAPIFNLDGQLLGLELTKLYVTDSSEDGIPIEGINYALNMNLLAPIIVGFDENFVTVAQTETMVSMSADLDYNDIAQEMIANAYPSVVSVIGASGLGSGIIYQKETLESGLYRYSILTNNHVVDENTELRIKFSETDEMIATDYQANSTYDVAIIRVVTDLELPVYDIPPITTGEAVDIVVGQDVYAMGTPYSTYLHNYVTQGIVSQINYTYHGVYQLGIVHEAEINPGNSGGPLFNLNGDVIGINVAKVVTVYVDGEGLPAEGINYSLNINVVATAISDFNDDGWVEISRSPKLGVTVANYSAESEYYPEIYLDGVVVSGFDYTRNAYLTVQLYDLIVGANGVVVHTIDDLIAALDGKSYGDIISLDIVRYDEQKNIITLQIDIILS